MDASIAVHCNVYIDGSIAAHYIGYIGASNTDNYNYYGSSIPDHYAG
jgi:hypothetical protein